MGHRIPCESNQTPPKTATQAFDSRYPRITARVDPKTRKRMDALKELTGISHGSIVATCIKNYIATLEERHGVR